MLSTELAAGDEAACVADLLKQRNAIDDQIAAIIKRPMLTGCLGEWIAARVFYIDLEASGIAKALDGRFRSGPLAGRTVNVKWYPKREGLVDLVNDGVDFYLVMTGPHSSAGSSRGSTRPLVIDAVYLFEATALLDDLRQRGRRIGTASSVRLILWNDAEVYPRQSSVLPITDEQRSALSLFGSAPVPSRSPAPSDKPEKGSDK